MTAKTAEHDTVMGALRSAQDVIEGILNATQALLTSLTYPDSSTSTVGMDDTTDTHTANSFDIA